MTTNPRTLTLHVKGEYFHQIATGQKQHEYRLRTEYWRRRLYAHEWDIIEICHGYPAKADNSRRLRFHWRGFSKGVITHAHFGPEPVAIYAINLTQPLDEKASK